MPKVVFLTRFLFSHLDRFSRILLLLDSTITFHSSIEMILKLFKINPPPPKYYNNFIFVNNTYFLIVHSVGLLNHMVGFYLTILIATLLLLIYHQSRIDDISILIKCKSLCAYWRIQDIRTVGRCINMVEISGSGDRFDASLHLSYVYVVSVENTIHIVDIAC